MNSYPAGKLKGRHCIALALLLCLPPLAGIVYLDLPLAMYLEFPPRTRYVVHAPFSWSAFVLVFLFVALVCLPFLYRLVTYKPSRERTAQHPSPFPLWGWLGLGWVLISWVIAWNRFPVFAPVQRYTFTPLWIGYIVVLNALTYRRLGTCLLCSQFRFFLSLFPASAVFWWYFEYLNRFVQNWYYQGGVNISALEYVVHASICFSTVLPAVVSTYSFFCTFPRMTDAFAGWHPLNIHPGRRTGWFLLTLAAASLSALPILPDFLFPLLWIAPLGIIMGIQLVSGGESIVASLKRGDWRPVVIPALAALLCGFFWEMWNWKSLAHWVYSVPHVHRFQLFAMPLLGYAGYLPFGPVCTEAAALIKAVVRE